MLYRFVKLCLHVNVNVRFKSFKKCLPLPDVRMWGSLGPQLPNLVTKPIHNG